MEENFAYEARGNGICILRCYGSSGSVVIPEELEGLPVTEVSAYAFAEEMEQEPQYDGGFPCICGEKLEELYLPKTVRRLGRYIFYNCVKLRKLSFYSNIAFIGAGAFTGCRRLSKLEMHWLKQNSCLREILQDLKQKVIVDCYAKPGKEEQESQELIFRLVFPEFYEEAVENTPARITSTQTHGVGIQYRNAFFQTRVVFQEYDRLFEIGKYNMDLKNVIEMAVSRLRYPYKLEEYARRKYAGWLSEHLEAGANYFLSKDDLEDLRWLAQEFIGNREQLELFLEAAKLRGHTEAVSMLLDVGHSRFPGNKKKLEL